VDTACSSSLVAIHNAVRSLQTGDSDVAIASGVNALLTVGGYISFTKSGMLSPDGRCKSFDKDANGYVRGEGIGAIILKPLAKAEADGDHIYGVIKASGTNHGGSVNTLTAPNPTAQAQLIIDTYRKAGIDPTSISYIECHGTGTPLGDPVEVNGLRKAFLELGDKEVGHCGLGTVKTNIGHLEGSAGIAGVIKVLLALQHKKLPGLATFKELNPYVQIENSPFYLVTDTQEWQAKGLRRAGVSSFGFGGTNAHVLIEEYVPPADARVILVTHSVFTIHFLHYIKKGDCILDGTSRFHVEVIFLGTCPHDVRHKGYHAFLHQLSVEDLNEQVRVYEIEELRIVLHQEMLEIGH
jgi:polyketide synthase PksN